MKFPEGARVRHRKTGRTGVVCEIVNGPDALDLDDTIKIVEWDEDGNHAWQTALYLVERDLESA